MKEFTHTFNCKYKGSTVKIEITSQSTDFWEENKYDLKETLETITDLNIESHDDEDNWEEKDTSFYEETYIEEMINKKIESAQWDYFKYHEDNQGIHCNAKSNDKEINILIPSDIVEQLKIGQYPLQEEAKPNIKLLGQYLSAPNIDYNKFTLIVKILTDIDLEFEKTL